MRIDGREIGPGHPPYVIAEMSGEHLGKIENAFDLIRAATNAGADAVKAQCFDPEKLAEARGGKDKVLTEGLWKGRTLGDLYRETFTPRHWFPDLFRFAKYMGITLFSSVFDEEGVSYLASIGCPALKIAAAESGDVHLMKAAKDTGLPVIVSINDVSSIGVWGYANAVLYCPPGYPCPIDQARLSRIRYLTHSVVGFSDHTLGTLAPVVAVSCGACIIEKHITLSRSEGGPDAAFSLEPTEFGQMVRDIRIAWEAK